MGVRNSRPAAKGRDICPISAWPTAVEQLVPSRHMLEKPRKNGMRAARGSGGRRRIASAQVFLNVLRDSLGAARAASDMLLPATDLGAVFPDAALRFIAASASWNCSSVISPARSCSLIEMMLVPDPMIEPR